MRVRMLYFAGIRDVIGRAEEDVDLPDDVRRIGDLRGWIAPRIDRERLRTVRIARNEEFAAEDDPIAPGDVIAWIPPVAGG